jgi:hypothetical protein
MMMMMMIQMIKRESRKKVQRESRPIKKKPVRTRKNERARVYPAHPVNDELPEEYVGR